MIKKGIFGCGFLINNTRANELPDNNKVADFEWKLSDRELSIIEGLSNLLE